jgi:hypothetical protein
MEMVQNLTSKFNVSLNKNQNIIFEQYTQSQIQSILEGRIQELKERFMEDQSVEIFEEKALKLLSGKVF